MIFARKPSVDILACLFGIGAWIAINGLWVELPLIVDTLPEKWNLPSYLSVIIQIANIGPIAYSLARVLIPQLKHSIVVYGVLGIGCISSLLLAVFWDYTSYINGTEHSTALLILVFLLSLVDCTSSVLFLPYMIVWKSIYLPSYLVGEGLSGLLPALVALGQGIGEQKCINVTYDNATHLVPQAPEPNFSETTFFYFLFSMMVASALAFTVLENWKPIQNERNSDSIMTTPEPGSSMKLVNGYEDLQSKSTLNNRILIILLMAQAWASSLTNAVLPSIQTYSCGPYGNNTYHLAATLSTAANPVAAMVTLILPRAAPRVIGGLTFIGTLIASYIMATAVLSPNPPFLDQTIGSVLVIISWVLFVGIMTYVRVEIANLMRMEGGRCLFWSGAMTQAGSAIGAVIIFILVNVANVFTPADPCS